MFTKTIRTMGSGVGLAVLYAALPAPAHSQTAPANPDSLITVPGETPLQQTVGGAVIAVCPHLKGAAAGTPQNNLFIQCHALVQDGTHGAGLPSLPGALQQISGNEVSSQGALATRVVGGQFANISGRLNALRLGSTLSMGQGQVAASEDADNGGPQLASVSTQQGDTDSSPLSASTQADGFAPILDLPANGLWNSTPALINASFPASGAVRVAQAGGSSSAEPSGAGASAAPLAGVSSPWGVFLEGSYNFGHHDLTVNEDPFKFHSSSVTAGIDYNFGTAVLGASAGYDDYDASFRTVGPSVAGGNAEVSGGSAEVKGTSGSLYGAWSGQHWTFNGIATYGKLTTDLVRVVNYNLPADPEAMPKPLGASTVDASFYGDPDGHYVAAGATAGYQYSAHAWDIMPSVSLSYRRASIASFGETTPNPSAAGAGLALYYDQQTVDSMRSIVGVDLSRPFSAAFGVLTPILRLEWDHEFRTDPRTVDAHYAADLTAFTATCASCFRLPTDAPSANYGIVGAGVSVLLARRLQAYLYYEDLFGEAYYQSQSIAIGLRGQF